MGEALRRSPISIWRAFRPNWRNAGLALLGAIVFGLAGIYVRWLSECWSEKQDCAGYFPLGIAISQAMSWPIFLAEWIVFGESGFVPSYDEVIAGYWWIILPVLWIYYYAAFTGAKAVIELIRLSGRHD